MGPADPTEPVKLIIFVKKRKLNDTVKDDKQTYYSFDAIFFAPENEISNRLKKSMIPQVRLFRRFRFPEVLRLEILRSTVSPKPRFYFSIVTKPNAF